MPELERLVQVGDFWQPRVAPEAAPAGMVRSLFVGKTPATARMEPMLTITRRPGADAPGQLQLTLAVALVDKEGQ